MSENARKLLGIRKRQQFVVTSFNAVFKDVRLHNTWWQASTLVNEINTRYQLRDSMEVKKSELLRVINKEYHEKSIEGNIFVGVGDSEQLKLFRHDFKTRNDGQQVKYDFFQVTARTIPQMYPTASNSEAWREQNASNLLPPRTRQHVDFTSSQIFCDDRGASSAVATNKKRKCISTPAGTTSSADDDALMSSAGTTPSLSRPPSSVSYWESGESRKRFCTKGIAWDGL